MSKGAKVKIGERVWVSCRSSAPCGGNQAIVKMATKLPKGGMSIRYRCATCNKPFHITF